MITKADYDELVRLRELGYEYAFFNEYETPRISLQTECRLSSNTLPLKASWTTVDIAAAIAEYDRAQEAGKGEAE